MCHIRHTGKDPQAPCVNSCCAYLFWGLVLSSDRAALPGEERRELSSFPPWCSRRTHRGHWHHDRKKQPLWKRRNTWRAMPARNPSFTINSALHNFVAPNRLEETNDEHQSHNSNFPAQNQSTSRLLKQKNILEKKTVREETAPLFYSQRVYKSEGAAGESEGAPIGVN